MLRTLDAKLHHRSPQGGGEYFGKDCGKRSKPKGQGSNSGLISTADYVYPCIIPYKERQLPNLNEEYVTPAKGDRPMHATTMTYAPVKPMFVSTSKHASIYAIYISIYVQCMYIIVCTYIVHKYMVYYSR